MRLEAVSIGKNPPHDVNVVIEVPIGGEPIKYEMDKEAGALVVDRFLYTAMRYPGNYGFIPHTLSDDGDPCDVIVANTRAIIPGAIMSCRVVGVLMMEDEAGGDEKIIAVPSAKLTRRYEKVKNYTDLPEITLPAGDEEAADAVMVPAEPDLLLQDPVHADIVWLCENWVLPRLKAPSPLPAQVIISIADRPTQFGAFDPEAVQLFEAFTPTDDRTACIWSPW